MVLAVLAWVGLWSVSSVLGYAPHASLWFPPSALDVALFLSFGRAAIPMVWIGAGLPTILGGAITGEPLGWSQIAQAVVYGAIHVCSYGGFAWVLGRGHSSRDKTDRVGAGFLSAPLFCGVAAVGGVLNLVVFADFTLERALSLISAWWIGDLIAVCTLTLPLLYLIDRRRFDDPLQVAVLRWLVVTTALFCASSSLVTFSAGKIPLSLVAYLQLIPLLWAAHRLSPISIALLVSWTELLFVGRAMLFGAGEGAFEYQGAMLAIGAIAYVGTAIQVLRAERSYFERLASIDGLTGLMNRMTFYALAETELARTRRRNGSLSVAVIDLDHFKRINDSQGHAVGDRALLLVAECLTSVVRTGDLTARWGGEEFVVCFPDTGLTTALEISERLRRAVATLSLGDGTAMAMLTASIGVAEIGGGESLPDAINRADSALYAAKTDGRNRVRSADFPAVPAVLSSAPKTTSDGGGDMTATRIASVALIALLAACAPQPAPDADPVVVELVFGLSTGRGGDVAPGAWDSFLTDVLAPRTPGFTALDCQGGWISGGTLVREGCKYVIVMTSRAGLPALAEAVDAYRRRFDQDSVLWIERACPPEQCRFETGLPRR
ncbi:DUF3574 domain-containing protein [Magnetospirillum fulvum]|nr:DUF3574 domain-containing protein [Magnetospirillum fulvum]